MLLGGNVGPWSPSSPNWVARPVQGSHIQPHAGPVQDPTAEFIGVGRSVATETGEHVLCIFELTMALCEQV